MVLTLPILIMFLVVFALGGLKDVLGFVLIVLVLYYIGVPELLGIG